MSSGTVKRRVNYCSVPNHRLVKRRRPEPNSVETLRYEFSDFKKEINAQREKEWWIELPTLEAHGYKWDVTVYPNSNEMNFALYLEDEGVIVKFKPICQLYLGSNLFEERKLQPDTIAERDPIVIGSFDRQVLYCFNDFTLEVDIEFLGLQKHVWFPEKTPRDETLAKLFKCKETSDVTFLVEGHMFDLHKNILFLKCKKLYEIANESGGDAHAIPIQSIKKGAFENMIEYIYTQKIHSVSLVEAKEILVAADLFECIDLKLYMESVITFYDLELENAAELLIFANSYSCALLWEAAVKLYILDAESVEKSEAWSRVRESNQVLAELLNDVRPKKRGAENNDDENTIEMMSVADLRNELQEADLALDGSRSVLVKRLETHRKETQDRNDQQEESGGTDGNDNDDEQDDTTNS